MAKNRKTVWLPDRPGLWLPHQPWAAHTKPLAPIGQAFADRGWNVVLASPDKHSQRAAALRFRLPYESAGNAWNVAPQVEEELSRTFMDPKQGNKPFCDLLYGHFAGMAKSMFQDLERLAAEMPPDLIIRDCSEWGSHLFAQKHGIECIPFDNGLTRNIVDHWGVIQPTLAQARDELGLDQQPDEVPGGFDRLWTPFPPELFLDGLPLPEVHGFQRELAAEAGAGLPAGVFEGRGEDLYIMTGSSGREAPGMSAMFDHRNTESIKAANQLGYPTLIGVGPENVERYRAIAAPNVRVEGWVDQNAALEAADVFGAHGGAGGIGEAIKGGTPYIGIPGFADQEANVREMERNGLGVGFPDWRSANAETIAEKVNHILENRATFQEAIERMQRRVAELPELNEVVEQIAVGGPTGGPAGGGAASGPRRDGPITIRRRPGSEGSGDGSSPQTPESGSTDGPDDEDEGPAEPTSGPSPTPQPLSTPSGGASAPTPERSEPAGQAQEGRGSVDTGAGAERPTEEAKAPVSEAKPAERIGEPPQRLRVAAPSSLRRRPTASTRLPRSGDLERVDSPATRPVDATDPGAGPKVDSAVERPEAKRKPADEPTTTTPPVVRKPGECGSLTR